MKKLLIGKVLKPRGLRGEMKFLSMISQHETLVNLETVYIGDTLYNVQKVTNQPGTRICFFRLEGIDHIDKAEALRGLDIMVLEDDVEMEEDE